MGQYSRHQTQHSERTDTVRTKPLNREERDNYLSFSTRHTELLRQHNRAETSGERIALQPEIEALIDDWNAEIRKVMGLPERPSGTYLPDYVLLQYQDLADGVKPTDKEELVVGINSKRFRILELAANVETFTRQDTRSILEENRPEELSYSRNWGYGQLQDLLGHSVSGTFWGHPLIEQVSRGVYRITPEGLEVYQRTRLHWPTKEG